MRDAIRSPTVCISWDRRTFPIKFYAKTSYLLSVYTWSEQVDRKDSFIKFHANLWM